MERVDLMGATRKPHPFIFAWRISPSVLVSSTPIRFKVSLQYFFPPPSEDLAACLSETSCSLISLGIAWQRLIICMEAIFCAVSIECRRWVKRKGWWEKMIMARNKYHKRNDQKLCWTTHLSGKHHQVDWGSILRLPHVGVPRVFHNVGIWFPPVPGRSPYFDLEHLYWLPCLLPQKLQFVSWRSIDRLICITDLHQCEEGSILVQYFQNCHSPSSW